MARMFLINNTNNISEIVIFQNNSQILKSSDFKLKLVTILPLSSFDQIFWRSSKNLLTLTMTVIIKVLAAIKKWQTQPYIFFPNRLCARKLCLGLVICLSKVLENTSAIFYL